jgi:hypothetical protein
MYFRSRLPNSLVAAFAILLAANLPAQQMKVLAPHRPIAPKVEKPIK